MSSVGPLPPTDPDREGTLAVLRVARTVTLVWALLGALVGIIALLEILFALLALRFPGQGVTTLFYAAIWVGVDLIMLGKFGEWEGRLGRGEYAPLQEPLLLWGVISLIFGVVPGLLLLLVYFRIQRRTGAPSPSSPPAAPTGGTSSPPPIYGTPPQ